MSGAGGNGERGLREENALLAARLEMLRLIARFGCHGMNNVLTYAGGQLSLMSSDAQQGAMSLERIAKMHEYLAELAGQVRRMHDVARYDGQRRPEPVSLHQFRESIQGVLTDVTRQLPAFRFETEPAWNGILTVDRIGLRIAVVAIGESLRRVAQGSGVCLSLACRVDGGGTAFVFRGPFEAAALEASDLYRAALTFADEEGGETRLGREAGEGVFELAFPAAG